MLIVECEVVVYFLILLNFIVLTSLFYKQPTIVDVENLNKTTRINNLIDFKVSDSCLYKNNHLQRTVQLLIAEIGSDIKRSFWSVTVLIKCI